MKTIAQLYGTREKKAAMNPNLAKLFSRKVLTEQQRQISRSKLFGTPKPNTLVTPMQDTNALNALKTKPVLDPHTNPAGDNPLMPGGITYA